MAEPYCFGRFTLDPSEGTLCADGIPVPLGPTDFRLLHVLVEHAGRTVTKENLMSRVWGPAAVADNVLYVHINSLRKALRDDFIENEQGRGYRFVLPSQEWSSDQRSRDTLIVGNLPSLWTGNATRGTARLIGRSEQQRVLCDLLASSRLVTVTGPGGVGKTRLALETAGQISGSFCDGVWLVELATLTDPELIATTVASALGVQIGAKAPPLETIARYLSRKSLLMIFDNCEHVIAAAASVAEHLLSGAPGVKILATSREPLSCSAEQTMDLPPLALSDEGTTAPEVVRKVPAVELFIERALEADVNFAIADRELSVVSRICRRVDGLPLAIEMVAGWAGPLGLETLETKLEGSVSARLRARSTAPLRHSTLHATLEWSHDLLSSAERTVLRRLSVFAGTFTLESAEAVAADTIIPKDKIFEHVVSLIRRSMIARAPGTRSQRYRLLETTRAFMFEKLTASGDVAELRQRHIRYLLDLLEAATDEWETTNDTDWSERYAPVLDDLRAALDWSMGEESNDAVALAGASWPLWRQLSLNSEGRHRLSAAVGRLRSSTPLSLEARLRRGLGELLLSTSAINAAHSEIQRAASLYEMLGQSAHLGSALSKLGFALFTLNRVEEAEEAISKAVHLLESAGWLRTLAIAYAVKTWIETTIGRFDAARISKDKALQLCELAGADRTALGVSANLVQLTVECGEVDEAISAGQSVLLRLQNTSCSDLRGFVLGVLAGARTLRGDLEEALLAAREAAPLLRDEGMLFWLFDHLALRAALAGRFRDAALIAGYSNGVYEKLARPRESMGRNAAERTMTILQDALQDQEITQFGHLGAQLSEEQALAIALSP